MWVSGSWEQVSSVEIWIRHRSTLRKGMCRKSPTTHPQVSSPLLYSTLLTYLLHTIHAIYIIPVWVCFEKEVMTRVDTPTLLKGPIILELARWQQLQLVMATKFTVHNAHTHWRNSLFYIACNYYFHRKSSFSPRARAQRRRGGAEERQQKKRKRGSGNNKIELSWVWLLQKRSKQ